MPRAGISFFVAILAIFVVFAGTTKRTTAKQAQPLTLAQVGDQQRRDDLNTKLDSLFGRLVTAKSETTGRSIENEIWKNWMALPDAEIRTLVAQALRARRSYNFEKARKILDKVVKLAPDYAEGWNQRAFVLFLQEKYDASLADIDKALELEPRHFGAMAGKARILMSQGRFALGQKTLRKAVKIHPFLRERAMIVEPPRKKL